MINLIALIDIAWDHKTILYDINPRKCRGYFDFRNQVICIKNKEDKKEVA